MKLGRQQTVDPFDACVPVVQFEVCANCNDQTMKLYVVAEGGLLNGEELQPNDVYTLGDGDIIGFSHHPRHQYEVTFVSALPDDDFGENE